MSYSLNFLAVIISLSLIAPVSALQAALTAKEAITSVAALSKSERQKTLLNEARKERIVRWTSSTPAESLEPVIRGFREKYPGVQLEYIAFSGRVLADRTIREYKAGKYDIDVLGSSAVTFLGLKDASVIESYFSPEAVAIKPGMKDPNGFWVPHYINVLTVLCNKNMVKTVPTDWREFTHPRWRGNFSIDTERFNWFLALRRLYGDDGAKNLISGYMQNGVLVKRRGELQIQLVAVGEYGCALAIYLNTLVHPTRKGAPLAYSVPEPILLNPALVMMTKRPPHPFAAMLLYDYIISTEGLSQITRAVPLLPPVEGLPVTDEIRPLQNKPFYFIGVDDQSRNFIETRDMYYSLIQK